MDRLTPAARDALDAYRESLALGAKRVDRNWTSIESRVDDPIVDAAPPSTRRRANAVAIAAAAIAVLAAVVALAVVVPSVLERRDDPPSGAAAPYEAIDDAPAASVTVQPPPVHAPPHEAPRVVVPEAARIERAPIGPVTIPVPPSPRPRRPTTPAPAVDPELDAAKRLVAETALLRRARVALRDGDATRAIAAADEHRRTFADGELAEEIAFVRLSALCAAGRIADGKAAARSFATRWPGSPLATRAAQACADG